MRLAWLTDIHLNFLDAAQRHRFLVSVREQADAVVISGDIGESHDVVEYLREMDEVIRKPAYFVLGNHDFYRGSIAKTRQDVVDVTKRSKHLNYLTAKGVVELTPNTAILGHDGWADGRLGDYDNSDVILNDHLLIAELSAWNSVEEDGGFTLNKEGLRQTMVALADEAVRHFETFLEEAAAKYPNVIVATHVPPFREAAWYQGKTSSDDYLPHFACQVVGDVMRRIMKAHPKSRLLVLCGHTHGGGEYEALDNLQVFTGEAKYGLPEIQRVIEVE